jgi:hypothetical protein
VDQLGEKALNAQPDHPVVELWRRCGDRRSEGPGHRQHELAAQEIRWEKGVDHFPQQKTKGDAALGILTHRSDEGVGEVEEYGLQGRLRLGSVVVVLQGRESLLAEGVDSVGEHLAIEVALAAEVVVDRRQVGTGVSRDLAYRRRGVSVPGEERLGGLEEAVAGLRRRALFYWARRNVGGGSGVTGHGERSYETTV